MSSRKDEIEKLSAVYGKENRKPVGDYWCSETTEDYIVKAFEDGAQWADSHQPTCGSCKDMRVVAICAVRSIKCANEKSPCVGRDIQPEIDGCNHYEEKGE